MVSIDNMTTLDRFITDIHDQKCQFTMPEAERDDIHSVINYLVHDYLQETLPKLPNDGHAYRIQRVIPAGSRFEDTDILSPHEFDFMLSFEGLSEREIRVSKGCKEGHVNVKASHPEKCGFVQKQQTPEKSFLLGMLSFNCKVRQSLELLLGSLPLHGKTGDLFFQKVHSRGSSYKVFAYVQTAYFIWRRRKPEFHGFYLPCYETHDKNDIDVDLKLALHLSEIEDSTNHERKEEMGNEVYDHERIRSASASDAHVTVLYDRAKWTPPETPTQPIERAQKGQSLGDEDLSFKRKTEITDLKDYSSDDSDENTFVNNLGNSPVAKDEIVLNVRASKPKSLSGDTYVEIETDQRNDPSEKQVALEITAAYVDNETQEKIMQMCNKTCDNELVGTLSNDEVSKVKEVLSNSVKMTMVTIDKMPGSVEFLNKTSSHEERNDASIRHSTHNPSATTQSKLTLRLDPKYDTEDLYEDSEFKIDVDLMACCHQPFEQLEEFIQCHPAQEEILRKNGCHIVLKPCGNSICEEKDMECRLISYTASEGQTMKKVHPSWKMVYRVMKLLFMNGGLLGMDSYRIKTAILHLQSASQQTSPGVGVLNVLKFLLKCCDKRKSECFFNRNMNVFSTIDTHRLLGRWKIIFYIHFLEAMQNVSRTKYDFDKYYGMIKMWFNSFWNSQHIESMLTLEKYRQDMSEFDSFCRQGNVLEESLDELQYILGREPEFKSISRCLKMQILQVMTKIGVKMFLKMLVREIPKQYLKIL